MTRQLRDYQVEADEAIDKAWANGMQRPAIVAATGLGKTDIIAKKAADRVRAGGRVLVLAHRFALMRQITARCRMHLPDESASVAGILGGKLAQRKRPIVAAMVQTLRTKRQLALFETLEAGDLVIVDECHHAGAKSYVDIMTAQGCYDETSGVQTFGVTATMYEEGRKHRGLGDVWEDVVFERDIVWAITHGPDPSDPYRSLPVGRQEGGTPGATEGWLVRPEALSVVVDHLDLSSVKKRGADFDADQIGEMVAQDADQIVDAWVTHASSRPGGTVGFFPTTAAVQAQRDAFERRGVSCEVVLADTDESERGDVEDGTGIYGRLAAGQTKVMLGLMVPTEGWDCPPVDTVLWARPTKIAGLAIQAWGRGLRRSPGKTDCLILDVVGGTRNLSLVSPAVLLPTIEIRETAPQACARCGRFKKPADKFDQRCICPTEERSEIGDRLDLRGLKTPIPYQPVDLVGAALAASVPGEPEFLWLQTRGGISFIPAKDRIVALKPGDDEWWKAGHVWRDRFEKGVELHRGTLEECKREAEWWVQSYCEPTYWQRDAPWRRKRTLPSDGQIRAARAMGIADPETYTKAALSDQLSIRAASRRLDRKPRQG